MPDIKQKKYFKNFTGFCDIDKTHKNRVNWVFYLKPLNEVFIKEKLLFFEVDADIPSSFYVNRNAPWLYGGHFW